MAQGWAEFVGKVDVAEALKMRQARRATGFDDCFVPVVTSPMPTVGQFGGTIGLARGYTRRTPRRSTGTRFAGCRRLPYAVTPSPSAIATGIKYSIGNATVLYERARSTVITAPAK